MKKRSDGRFRVKRTIDGKVRYFYGTTRLEALQKAEAAQTVSERPKTFWEMLKCGYDEKWDSFAYGTKNCYRSSYQRALDEFGDAPCEDIEPMEIQCLLEALKKENYSEKSVKTQKTVISTIYKYAMLRGWSKTNPATPTVIPKGLPMKSRAAFGRGNSGDKGG